MDVFVVCWETIKMAKVKCKMKNVHGKCLKAVILWKITC